MAKPVGGAITHPDGSTSLPADVSYDVHRILLHYQEMPRLCGAAIEAQRRVDESHWLADCAERRAREPLPMPTWELLLYVGGAGVGAFLLGLVVGYVGNDGITIVTP